MVRRIFATLLCALVCLALPASGLAQGQVLTASIPFNFNFGEREMAQGKYTILIEGNGVVQLRSEHDGALALSRHAEPGASSYAAPGDSRGPNVLQFRRYGDLYFLSKIFWLGSAVEISQSKSEREIAKNYRGGPTLATAAAK